MKRVMKKMAMVLAMFLISGSAQAAMIFSDTYTAPNETLTTNNPEVTVTTDGAYLVEGHRELSGSFEGWDLDGYTDITATLTFVWHDDDNYNLWRWGSYDIRFEGTMDTNSPEGNLSYQEQALVTLDGTVVLNNEIEIDVEISSYDLILTDLSVLDNGVVNYLVEATTPANGAQDFILNSVTLTIEGTPSAVPVPGAVWLLGSGLLGLTGLRRKNSA